MQLPQLPEIADFVVSQKFVIGYCAFIILYALIWLIPLRWKSRRIRKDLRIALASVQQAKDEGAFCDQYQRINADISQLPCLCHAWSEFAESLLHPKSDEKQTIRNTHRSDSYFGEYSIIKPHIDTRIYSSVPNHLTGLGILGTFIGLAAGIGLASAEGLAEGSIDEAQLALQHLLSGAALAFLTSITGLSASFIFLVVERRTISTLHKWLDKWMQALDSRLELITPEKLQDLALLELKQQTCALKTFNTDLAVSIGSALDQSIETRLAPSLKQLADSFDAIRDQRSATSETMIEHVMNELKDTVTGAAGKELQEIAGTLTSLNQTLLNSISAIGQSQDDMKQSINDISRTVQATMASSSEAMQADLKAAMQEILPNIGVSTQMVAEQLESSGARAAESVASGIGSLSSSISKLEETTLTSADMLESMGTSIIGFRDLTEKLKDTHSQFDALISPLMTAAASFKTAGDKIRDSIDGAIRTADKFGESVNHLEIINKQTRESWEEYRQRFEGIDTSLNRIFQEINEGLEKYTRRVSEFTIEVDEHMSKAVQGLAAAVAELGDVLEDLPDRT